MSLTTLDTDSKGPSDQDLLTNDFLDSVLTKKTMQKEKIIIVGAGLCGSLLALRMAQRGYQVLVYENKYNLNGINSVKDYNSNMLNTRLH